MNLLHNFFESLYKRTVQEAKLRAIFVSLNVLKCLIIVVGFLHWIILSKKASAKKSSPQMVANQEMFRLQW